jgi:hypothetical protein
MAGRRISKVRMEPVQDIAPKPESAE